MCGLYNACWCFVGCLLEIFISDFLVFCVGKMKILLVMGLPGSGKGTQAKLLEKKYNLVHISTGDLFRAAVANGTELGLKAKEYMEAGKYVPDELTIGLLKDRVSQDDCKEGFVLDGFPRTLPQAEFLDKMLDEMNEKISGVLYYNVADDIVVQRIKGRAEQDQAAGKDVRADDLNEETISARIKTYHDNTTPVIDYYKEKSVLVELDASKSIEEIFDATVSQLD